MEIGERITSMELETGEEMQEVGLRPQTLDDYIGQQTVTDNLKVFIEAAKRRGEPLDHLLFYGPPGLGKTTLAGIIAKEMGVDIRITSGPAIERAGDLAAILTNLNENDVLFIDEIHRLNRSVEEVLYSAMEDYALDIIIGKGPSARSIRLDLSKFTLVGATTRAGSLSAPLRDRFGVVCKFEIYTVEELKQIIRRSAVILGVDIDEQSLTEIAMRSRGTPRIANRLLKRVRDFSQVKGNGTINAYAGWKSAAIGAGDQGHSGPININGNINTFARIAMHDFQFSQILAGMERHEIAFSNRPPPICPQNRLRYLHKTDFREIPCVFVICYDVSVCQYSVFQRFRFDHIARFLDQFCFNKIELGSCNFRNILYSVFNCSVPPYLI